MITRTASARYEGMGKTGKGWLSTQSGVLKDQPYDFTSRFQNEAGTNPEELIAAAHAGCFTMALSFKLDAEGIGEGRLETVAKVRLDQDGDGYKVSRSDLALTAAVPGIDGSRLRQLAEDAKATCPISKLLNAEMTLDVTISEPAEAQ